MLENNQKNEQISGNNAQSPSPVPQSSNENMSTKGFLMEIAKFTILSILIVAPIRFFIAQPFIVRGESMDPTFANGQYLIIDEITYRKSPPERGDVVVFKYPKDESKYFIKRIIGLPGETVDIINGKVNISSRSHPEKIELSEPYIQDLSFENTSRTLGTDEYFAMGDNRSNSLDSRIWGPLPKKNITGRVFVRLFPFKEIGLFPGKQTE